MDLVEKFESMGLTEIDEFIRSQAEKNLLLDFKTVGSPNFSNDDKKNLAKALSGFANSSGGLIVWGVDARKNAQGIDCASAKKEIDQVRQFVCRLNSFTGDAVSPIVDGVLHKAIESADGRGFAVSLISESDSGPHMAKMGEDRYYKRSGDSFYKMEHFDVADMFGRRKKPKLDIVIQVVARDATIAILNSGRGSARAPYLAFDVPSPFELAEWGLDGNGHDGLPRLARSYQDKFEYRFGASANFTIHPGMLFSVAKIRSPRADFPDGLTLNFEVGAEDIPTSEGAVDIER